MSTEDDPRARYEPALDPEPWRNPAMTYRSEFRVNPGWWLDPRPGYSQDMTLYIDRSTDRKKQ